MLQVHTVVSTNCLSAGEALRLLDQRDLVKTDFVLVAGGRVWRGGVGWGVRGVRPGARVGRTRVREEGSEG